ncbi:hypothetical protein MY10362_008189 [Beauveria mimosiformis]
MANDDHGPWLTLAMVIFLTWALLFYGVRLWAKLRIKTIGADDWAVTGALIISIACQGIMHSAVSKGYGKRSDSLSVDALDSINKRVYIGQFFYIVSVGFTRVASALLSPIVITRLYYLAPSNNNDPNQSSVIAAIYTAAALQFSIVATCFTALKPFLAVFRQPVVAYGSSGGILGFNAGLGESCSKLKLFRRVKRLPEGSDASANWRPDQGSAQRSITAKPGRAVTRKRRDDKDDDRDRLDHSCINLPRRASNRAMDDGASTQTDESDRIMIQRMDDGASTQTDESDRIMIQRMDDGASTQTDESDRMIIQRMDDGASTQTDESDRMIIQRMDDGASTQTDESDRRMIQRMAEVAALYEHNKSAGGSGEV